MSNPPAASPTAPSGGGGTGHKWTPWQIIIMFALIVLTAAVIVALIANAGDTPNGTSTSAESASTPASSPPAPGSPPPTTPPTTSAATSASASAAAPVKPLKKGEVRVVRCTTSPAPRPGAAVTIIATIEADRPGTIGISAGTYLKGGDDTDYGANDDSADDPNHRLNVGAQDVRLAYNVPGSLKTGTYEISGQLWPTDDIGGDNDLTARTCATMPVR